MLTAAERASGLTRELLAFARQQEQRAQPLQLSHAISAVRPMLERIVGPSVSIVFVLEPELATVRADPSRIEQMLLNLILNARDAMPHMNGVALAESLRTALPGVRVLYLSGHVEHEIIRAAKIAPSAFLRKPFTPDALLRAVRRVLDAAAPVT